MKFPTILALLVLAALPASPGKSSSAASVTFIPSAEVAAAFVKGRPLIEVENYKVHASHRDAAGMGEVHEQDTDIVYVLEGSAVLVTGGELVGGKTTAPEEIRGASIRGGESRRLVKGDVVIIPNGVPHWFKEVPGPFNYYVVKVRAAE